jgi:hypothetical protein
MFSKVKTTEDFAVILFGIFLFILGSVAFLAIASVIVKGASYLDSILF